MFAVWMEYLNFDAIVSSSSKSQASYDLYLEN